VLYLDGAETTINQAAAMLSLMFNIGPGAFKRSLMLVHHRAGKTAKAHKQWNWCSVTKGGQLVVVNGLINRRIEER
jgi:GH24 family phage-related lysozyme (muramidase)